MKILSNSLKNCANYLWQNYAFCSTAAHWLVLLCAQNHGQLYASRSTLDEIAIVLGSKKFEKYLPANERALFVKNYAHSVALIEPTETITDCRDAKDNQFLELALAAQADILVSSDEGLLVLHPWRGVVIIKPADFMVQYIN